MTSLGPKPPSWRRLRTETVFRSRHLAVERRACEIAPGVQIDDYEVVKAPDWVGVVAITDSGGERQHALIAGQNRHGAELQPLGQMHRADQSRRAVVVSPLRHRPEGEVGRLRGSTRPRHLPG